MSEEQIKNLQSTGGAHLASSEKKWVTFLVDISHGYRLTWGGQHSWESSSSLMGDYERNQRRKN